MKLQVDSSVGPHKPGAHPTRANHYLRDISVILIVIQTVKHCLTGISPTLCMRYSRGPKMHAMIPDIVIHNYH